MATYGDPYGQLSMKGVEDYYLTQPYFPSIFAIPYPTSMYTQTPYRIPFTDINAADAYKEKLRLTRLYNAPASFNPSLQSDLQSREMLERMKQTRLFHAPASFSSSLQSDAADRLKKLSQTRLFRIPNDYKSKFQDDELKMSQLEKLRASRLYYIPNTTKSTYKDTERIMALKENFNNVAAVVYSDNNSACVYKNTDNINNTYTKSHSPYETLIVDKACTFEPPGCIRCAPYGSFM